MLIAQISDLHVKAKGTLLFGSVDTYGMAERAVGRIMGLDPRPDVVLITGDLANDGGAEDLRAVSTVLAPLSMPVFPMIGNHDDREAARDSYSGSLPDLAADRFAYAADLGQVRLVALDSHVPGRSHGTLGTEQLQWLDAELAACRDRPTIVALHHPPFDTGIGFMDAIGLSDADAMAVIIAGHPQVERVLCGHVHRSIQARFAGTIAMTAPATGHQVAFDLRADAPARWTAEPPGMLLHHWNGSEILTHLICTDGPAAPSAFSDDHIRAADTDASDASSAPAVY